MERCGNCKWKFSERCIQWESDSGRCNRYERKEREDKKLDKVDGYDYEFSYVERS